MSEKHEKIVKQLWGLELWRGFEGQMRGKLEAWFRRKLEEEIQRGLKVRLRGELVGEENYE